MDRDERQHLRAISDEVDQWVTAARSVLAHREGVVQAATKAAETLQGRAVPVRRASGAGWSVIPLGPAEAPLLSDIAQGTQLPALDQDTTTLLQSLTTDVAAAVHDAKSAVGFRRFFAGDEGRARGEKALDYLAEYRAWALDNLVLTVLDQLVASTRTPKPAVSPDEATADWVGLRRHFATDDRLDVVPAEPFKELPAATKGIKRALVGERRLHTDAVKAGDEIRRAEALTLLSDMPIERLKEATTERLLLGPLTEAGITSVKDVLDRGQHLDKLPGIGPTTATRTVDAANALWQLTVDEAPVRLDITERTGPTTNLLRRLRAWDVVRTTTRATTNLALKDALAPLARRLDRRTTRLLVASRTATGAQLVDAATAVVRGAHELDQRPRPGWADDPWDDFAHRPSDYFAMLDELGFANPHSAKTTGDLPDDIVQAIRDLELDTEHLVASLRGYQSFGARFALVQRKVIIGDEMGLGKTVEALAALAHLQARGATHFVVVCPAAVVTNWVREVHGKSLLQAFRLHGATRDTEAARWLKGGGVAVTTFETLPWFEASIGQLPELSCVVVDEAHYIKNPGAKRSRLTAGLIRRSERAILLTGTPMENRVDEFCNLVRYLRPDLTTGADDLAPRQFRKQVAPAYLRRNQEDVLTELPDLVEVDEWLPLSDRDEAAYAAAVSDGNFMAMRQAAMLGGTQSTKIQRLIDIVDEARENGRRVLVFSQFRAVLDQVVRALHGPVFGPLTGSVPAAERQDLVDAFSAEQQSVLVAQIVAGGQGLNIQAASVVVICEPQLKPTTEWQAIARARRMGQLESVQVHRLLSEDGVDERITEILARKSELFDDFARVSDTAGSAPEAFDISEAQLARQMVAAERERLFSTAPTAETPVADLR